MPRDNRPDIVRAMDEAGVSSTTGMFDLKYPVKRADGSTRWIQVGTGIPGSKGSISLLVDAITVGFDGHLHLFPRRER